MRPTIDEILEECRRERDAERVLELVQLKARIGEHVCRPRRVGRFSGSSIVCEVCRERMRENNVLNQIKRNR